MIRAVLLTKPRRARHVVAQAHPAAATKSPIRGLIHSPRVVYDDQMLVFEKFKATRRARPGFEWGAIFTVTGKYASIRYCNSFYRS